MDIYLLYAYVGIVCAGVIAMILNRVRSTEYKKTVDAKFCGALAFFVAFCIVDTAWGIIGSPTHYVNQTAYLLSTYGFHIMAAWASFVCSAYVLHNMNVPEKKRKFFRLVRYSLITLQMILIFQNIFTGLFFTIDENGVYHSGIFRTVAFLMQFCHYLPIIVYLIPHLHSGEKDRTTAYVYSSSLIFSVLPLVFGMLQMAYPDGPFYSMGFLVTAVTMYAFNVTEQRESYLAAYYTAEEQEKSRAQIEEALKKAEAANIAKTVFLSNMSHDIRTPINGIMGMLTLAKKEPMSETLAMYLKKIDVASRHLLSLINDVLDMSRIESGKTEIQMDPTDVTVIADNCTSIIQGQIEGRNLTFIKKCDGITHSRVFADVLRIRQVLINILGNACKFTPDGGTVTFEIRETAFDGETVWMEFIVEDTGIGMSEEFQQHIFEAFSQENNGSRGDYIGTGLGMTISKELVGMMDGTISVKSERNHGSTFTVTLPFKVDTSEKLEPATAKDVPAQTNIAGWKILLVEDNELNMEIASSILTDEGAVVTEAENGQIAVDKFTGSEPGTFDVILMDIMMPVMNGYDAAKAIRASAHPEAGTIPIIAMTANAFAEDKIRAVDAGMNSHVAKPINFPQLISEILAVKNSVSGRK